MKNGTFIYLFAILYFLMSCEIEPFEGDSLSESEAIEIPASEDETREEEAETSEEEFTEGIGFSTGTLSFVINSRSFNNDQNNAVVAGSETTVVSVHKLTGERISIRFNGNSTGLYDLGNVNEALYYADFLQEAYTTALNQGSGVLDVTRYDQINNQIDGLFNFIAYRERKDVLGNVVLDLEGNVVYDRVDILQGEFEMIPLN